MLAPSLRTKITLALLFVGLSSAALVGVVAREILLRRFDQIQLDESFGRFHDDVVGYVSKYQTWDSAVRAEPFGNYSRQRNAARGPAGRGRLGGPPPDVQPRDAGPPPDGGQPPDGPPPDGPPIRPRQEEQPPFRFLLLEPKTGRVLLGPDEY